MRQAKSYLIIDIPDTSKCLKMENQGIGKKSSLVIRKKNKISFTLGKDRVIQALKPINRCQVLIADKVGKFTD